MSEADARIFVVDDDASMRDALQRLLRSVGLQVATFASAREFLHHRGFTPHFGDSLKRKRYPAHARHTGEDKCCPHMKASHA